MAEGRSGQLKMLGHFDTPKTILTVTTLSTEYMQLGNQNFFIALNLLSFFQITSKFNQLVYIANEFNQSTWF